MEETLSMGRDLSLGWSPGLTGAIARPRTATPLPMAGVRLRQVFAGEASQLGQVREWLASLLPPGEMRADVISVATELGSNAIKHTASGQGASFVVELVINPFTVRVAVADGGGPGEPRVIEDPSAEHGRGLLLVRGLTDQAGVSGDHRGRIVWADVAWHHPEPSGVSVANGHGRPGTGLGDVASGHQPVFGRKETRGDCFGDAADAAASCPAGR